MHVFQASQLTQTDEAIFLKTLAADWSVLALVLDSDTDEQWDLVTLNADLRYDVTGGDKRVVLAS